ncbi:hypothetical protein [Olivibacter oleidegradans]|uniref:Uncharacterized protein n=1 Tax=Olivibacter oleidegradans TaxID=760123 RepID=A0ABV6HPF1_9SPHI
MLTKIEVKGWHSQLAIVTVQLQTPGVRIRTLSEAKIIADGI